MDSKVNQILQNRQNARISIDSGRRFESLSGVVENICALNRWPLKGDVSEDIGLLKEIMESIELTTLKDRVQQNLLYALRILEGKNLDTSEIDLAFSLVGSALMTADALTVVGVFELVESIDLVSINEVASSSRFLYNSEKRMFRSNSLYQDLGYLISRVESKSRKT